MEKPTHPLQTWLDLKGVSYEEAAKICQRRGRKTSAEYLYQICRGYYAPSYAFAKFLSASLTEGAVSVSELKEYPYTRESAA